MMQQGENKGGIRDVMLTLIELLKHYKRCENSPIVEKKNDNFQFQKDGDLGDDNRVEEVLQIH
jgi:hypothetical protein